MKRVNCLIVFILLAAANVFAQGHFQVSYDGNGQDHMTIYIVSATIGGVDLVAGDEIAAYDGTICSGKTILKKSIIISDKNTFEKLTPSKKEDGMSNGYTIGNNITFKMWDSVKSKELSGITAEFINPANGQTITPPTYTPGETAFVKLSVTSSVNKTPVSNSGADQSVNEKDIVTLDGTASSDPDGDLLTFLWTAPAGITLSSTTSAKPTFTSPNVNIDTFYTFSLVVNDGTENSIDEVVITVKQVNKVPVAKAGTDQILNENSTCTLNGSGSSDPDGNLLTYLWTAPAGIVLSSITSEKPTFNVPEIKQDTVLNFSLIVNDGITNSEPSTVKVFVINVIKTGSEIFGKNDIQVYPNPSKGIYSIRGLKANQQNKIEIYTIDGQLISLKKSNSIPEIVDISDRKSGTYLLYIDKNPFKIIKQ